jgi:hypothetical protein
LRLTFADGLSGEVEVLDRMRGPAFATALTPSGFAAVSVDEETGTIVWRGGADLAPDTLYERVSTGLRPEQSAPRSRYTSSGRPLSLSDTVTKKHACRSTGALFLYAAQPRKQQSDHRGWVGDQAAEFSGERRPRSLLGFDVVSGLRDGGESEEHHERSVELYELVVAEAAELLA